MTRRRFLALAGAGGAVAAVGLTGCVQALPGPLPGRVGVWLQDPAHAAAWKALGVDFYYGLWNPQTNSAEGGPTTQQLAQLRAAGMPVVCHPNDAAYADRATVNGLITWHEPDLSQDGTGGPAVPIAEVKAAGDRIRAREPRRNRWIVLSSGVAIPGWHGMGSTSGQWEPYLKECVTTADVLSFDYYPWNDPGSMSTQLGRVTASPQLVVDGVRRMKAWAPGKPVYVFLSCGFIGTGTLPPTAGTMQLTKDVIDAGAHGICWFAHDFTPTFSDRHPLVYDDGSRELVRQVSAYVRQRLGA